MGIFEGLKLIQRRDHDQFIIQFDSLEVLKPSLETLLQFQT